MTAELLEYTTESDIRVRRLREARAAGSHRTEVRSGAHPGAGDRWAQVAPQACTVDRPARVAASGAAVSAPLAWTPRGLAVMVSSIVITTGVMVGTLVGSFLAVSNEPMSAVESGAVAAVAVIDGQG